MTSHSKNLLVQTSFSCFILLSVVILYFIFNRSLGATDHTGAGGFGQIDFSQYWSALRLATQGINPYDPANMLDFQAEHFQREAPIMMWNPPWLLLLLYPILQLPFTAAALAWTVAHLLLAAVAGLLTASALSHPKKLTWQWGVVAVLSPLWFAPFHNSLFFGQLGALLLLGSALLYRGLVAQNAALLATGALIVSLKPHIFFLLGVVMLWWFIRHRKWDVLFLSIISFGLLLWLCEMTLPNSISWWLSTTSPEENDIVPTTRSWVGPTLGGALRAYFGPAFRYPGILLAPLISISFLVYLMRVRPRLQWATSYAALLLISVFCAPFGWFFDQTVLLLTFLTVLYLSYSSKQWVLLFSLIAVQVGAYIQMTNFAQYQHEMFWFAPTLGLIFSLCHWTEKSKSYNLQTPIQ